MEKKKRGSFRTRRGQGVGGRELLLATSLGGKMFRIAERLRCGLGSCVGIAVCHKAREGQKKKKKKKDEADGGLRRAWVVGWYFVKKKAG